MKSVRSYYLRKKIDDRLHFEDFAPAPIAAPAPGSATGAITFANAKLEVANEGKSLLETAEAAGLTPEYGCRMGICFTCTSTKTSGTTTNLLTGETNSDPDTEIQICVTAACGDVSIEL
jgi:ferredoxin